MSGGLKGLFADNGQFDNFNYYISNLMESGVNIPFIKNDFLEKLFIQGVNDVKVSLNGNANNPDAQVDIKLKQVQLKMKGKLLDKDSNYSMLLYHNDLKGFLFSKGFLKTDIMDYFYDDVPFVFKGNVIGNNINDVKLQIRDDLLKGSLNFENNDTNLSLTGENFDLKNILKRLKTKSDCTDFLLKFIQSVPVNLNLNINKLHEYKDNIFTNVIFDLKNATNPGSLKLSFKNDKNELNLTTDILNSNAFDGTLKLKNYRVSNDILKNKVLSLQDANMDLDLNFKTFGLNTNSLISNLSGKYKLSLLKGKFVGISNYETILAGMFNLSNITTNAILGIIENSFKEGILSFKKLNISGELEMAKIKDSIFSVAVPNIDIAGSINGDLIGKSLQIRSIFSFKELAPEILKVAYNLDGFTSNLKSKVDLTSIILKVNPTYLQKKKRDLMIK